VILGITPQINESGRVTLEIEQEVSSVVNTTTSTIDSPTIRQRRIHTNVAVNDGEALVLGGLIQDSKTVSRSQVPLLGDLPFIGNAFKKKTNEMGKTELIVIITPYVLRDARDARRITEDFRREIAINAPRRIKQHRSLENTARRMLD
jgi:general secretion pathway protein D